MKNINCKRFLSVLMILLCLCMTACNKAEAPKKDSGSVPAASEKEESSDSTPAPTPASDVTGQWKGTLKVGPTVLKAMGKEYEDFAEYFDFDNVTIAVNLKLNEDGTFALSSDEDWKDKVVETLWQGILNVYAVVAEESGIALDELWTSMDTTKQQRKENILELAQDDIAQYDDLLPVSGTYEYKDGTIKLQIQDSDRTGSGTVEQDTIKITALDTEADVSSLLPIALTKN